MYNLSLIFTLYFICKNIINVCNYNNIVGINYVNRIVTIKLFIHYNKYLIKKHTKENRQVHLNKLKNISNVLI